MTLADALASAERTAPGPRCGVAKVLETLGEADRKTFLAALDNPAVEASTLSRALRNEGIRLGYQTINRHRRGDCWCGS